MASWVNSGINVLSAVVVVSTADHATMAVALTVLGAENPALVPLVSVLHLAESRSGPTASSMATNSCGACELGISPVTFIHGPSASAPATSGAGPHNSSTGYMLAVELVVPGPLYIDFIGVVSTTSSSCVPVLGRILSIGAEVASNGAFMPCKLKVYNVLVMSSSTGGPSTVTTSGTLASSIIV